MKKVFTVILSFLFWGVLTVPIMCSVFFSDGLPAGIRIWAILAFVVVSCMVQFRIEKWVKDILAKQD